MDRMCRRRVWYWYLRRTETSGFGSGLRPGQSSHVEDPSSRGLYHVGRKEYTGRDVRVIELQLKRLRDLQGRSTPGTGVPMSPFFTPVPS